MRWCVSDRARARRGDRYRIANDVVTMVHRTHGTVVRFLHRPATTTRVPGYLQHTKQLYTDPAAGAAKRWQEQASRHFVHSGGQGPWVPEQR